MGAAIGAVAFKAPLTNSGAAITPAAPSAPTLNLLSNLLFASS